jgi:hypothetical protein
VRGTPVRARSWPDREDLSPEPGQGAEAGASFDLAAPDDVTAETGAFGDPGASGASGASGATGGSGGSGGA